MLIFLTNNKFSELENSRLIKNIGNFNAYLHKNKLSQSQILTQNIKKMQQHHYFTKKTNKTVF